jgi:thioredoxin 2
MTNAYICTCPHCGTKNRIPENRMATTARCGRCHESFSPQNVHKQEEVVLTLRCSNCRTKNRVPAAKLNAGAKCGRCAAALQHQNVLTGTTVMVTDANFHQTVVDSPLPVLLYAWSTTCPVCTTTGPQVEQMASETKGKVRVAKLNVEANPHLATTYNVSSVPTFLIFDAGKLKEQIPGAVPKHDLLYKMARYI